MSTDVNRRRYVATVATTAAGWLGGCGSVGGYETAAYCNQAVPLAPLDDVYRWYEDGYVVALDARSAAQDARSYVVGAKSSSAPTGSTRTIRPRTCRRTSAS